MVGISPNLQPLCQLTREILSGTLDVRVRGNWLIPPSIFNRLTIFCVILRHIHLLLSIFMSGELASIHPSAIIVDQLSAGLPLLRDIVLPHGVPIFFYCHFPDLLLVQGRQASALKRLYRVPFDAVEEWSMGFADAVAVNSNFTKSIVAKTWPGLSQKVDMEVVYPCVDIATPTKLSDEPISFARDDEPLILSINRFERKKDIALAVKAFAKIPTADRQNVRLVLAGGYDQRVAENVQYHAELELLAESLSLSHATINNTASTSKGDVDTASVVFLLSVSNSLKSALLQRARLLAYTPSNEHFGIVPLEAMLAGLPVLAANTGGPVETVVDGETGWLREPDDPQAWSDVMRSSLKLSAKKKAAMGKDGAERVKGLFGREHMSKTIDDILTKSKAVRDAGKQTDGGLIYALTVFAGIASVAATILAVALGMML